MSQRAHRKNRRCAQPYSWLGAGAVTVGIGAALTTGAAVAHADAGPDTGGRTSTAASSTSDVSSKVTRAHRGPRHQHRSPAAAAGDSPPSAGSKYAAVPASRSARATAVTSAPVSAAKRGHDAGRAATRPQRAVVSPPASAAITSVVTPAAPAAGITGSLVGAKPTPEPEPIDTEDPIGPIQTVGVSIVTTVLRIDDAIYRTLDGAANWLAGLPDTPLTEFLEGTLLLVRRNFFNQVPTVSPVQLTGQAGGPITGEFGAVDPEGESITYTLVAAPKEGTVTIDPNGTYTYTPGSGFDGSDAFVIAADDQARGLINGNILQPRRPAGTDALVTVEQGSPKLVTFNFGYATYAKGLGSAEAIWELNPRALPALQWSAFQLADAVNPQHTVTLNYLLGLAPREALANASSDSINGQDSDFYMTLVQNRIVNGTNPTGATVDGNIRFNFRPTYPNDRGRYRPASWAYFAEADSDQYSFESTATHEMLHSFGFTSRVEEPGCNEFVCNDGEPTPDPKTNWFFYDQFLGNAEEQAAIDKTTMRWDPAFDHNLTGVGNGLYFLGKNAVTVFGGPVPLFSPEEYSGGSSVAHLADYFFNNKTQPDNKYYVKLMNSAGDAGEPNLPLSALEIAMLKDLGYKM